MKKVLLIARARTEGAKELAGSFAERIRRELGDDIAVENCEILELAFEIGSDSVSIYHPEKKFDLRDFDLVIIRHIGSRSVEAHAITTYCEYFGIKYTDTYLNRLLLDNKLSTQLMLWTKGIKRWPRTLYGPTHELMRRLPELGSRAIFKDNEGSKGRLNFVVQTPADIERISEEYPDVSFVLQEFVPNDSDLRVLVLGGRPAMVIRRASDGSSHLNNTSQGGTAEIVPMEEVEADILKTAQEVAMHTKLQVAGVDVMTNLETGDFVLLEVNNAPQISSGSFIEEKSQVYAQMIRELMAQ